MTYVEELRFDGRVWYAVISEGPTQLVLGIYLDQVEACIHMARATVQLPYRNIWRGKTMKTTEKKQKALEAIDGLLIGDCLEFFDSRATERDRMIAELVPTDCEHERDGSIISEDDVDYTGAWVLTWTWVYRDDEDELWPMLNRPESDQ